MLYLLSGMRMPCPTCAQVLLPIPVSVRCQLSRGAIPTTFPEAAPPPQLSPADYYAFFLSQHLHISEVSHYVLAGCLSP